MKIITHAFLISHQNDAYHAFYEWYFFPNCMHSLSSGLFSIVLEIPNIFGVLSPYSLSSALRRGEFFVFVLSLSSALYHQDVYMSWSSFRHLFHQFLCSLRPLRVFLSLFCSLSSTGRNQAWPVIIIVSFISWSARSVAYFLYHGFVFNNGGH